MATLAGISEQGTDDFKKTLKQGDFLSVRGGEECNKFRTHQYVDVWVTNYDDGDTFVCKDEDDVEYTYTISHVWWVYTNGDGVGVSSDMARRLNDFVHGDDV